MHVCAHKDQETEKGSCHDCANPIYGRRKGFLSRLSLKDGLKPVVEAWKLALRRAFDELEARDAGAFLDRQTPLTV